MKKVIILALLLSGCGAIIAPNPMQKGHIAIVADAEGMRAFSDMSTGLVAESKTPGNMKSSYFQHRDLRETEETRRALAPSFLQGLFASTPKQGE
jgi:hypothetical protein